MRGGRRAHLAERMGGCDKYAKQMASVTNGQKLGCSVRLTEACAESLLVWRCDPPRIEALLPRGLPHSPLIRIEPVHLLPLAVGKRTRGRVRELAARLDDGVHGLPLETAAVLHVRLDLPRSRLRVVV